MPDEVKPIDQSVTATLPVETPAPAPVPEGRPTQLTFIEKARKTAYDEIFGKDAPATQDTTSTVPDPTPTPVVAAPLTTPEPVKAPDVTDPVVVATSWIQSADPERQKMGWEMLERVKASKTQQAAPVQPTGPNWEERAQQIHNELVEQFKKNYTKQVPYVNEIGDVVPGAFVTESTFDENNPIFPIFKEMIAFKAERILEKEQNEYNQRLQQEQQQRQIYETVRAQHEDRVNRTFTKGVIINDKNTAELFPKTPEGQPDPKAVKVWKMVVQSTLTDPEFVNIVNTRLASVPEAELSKHVVRYAWDKFSELYGLGAAPAPPAAPAPTPATPEPAKPSIPANLLGAASSPMVDNKPAIPQAEKADIDRTKFRTIDPVSPEHRAALRELVMSQNSSGG